MFNSTTTFTLVSGLVGASTYVPPTPDVALVPVPSQAVESLLRARVDIYCGRRAQAVADIREARTQLRASHASVSPETMRVLDEASWFTRHHEHVLAERSLDTVLEQLTAHRGV